MSLVDEIITIAELERGTFELRLEPTSTSLPLVRHAVDEVARPLPDGRRARRRSRRELRSVADGPRIDGVVRELLDNACRYSPARCAVELSARSLLARVS